MNFLRIILISLISGSLALAGGHTEGVHTDIVPRSVNFLIFAGLVYYLLADKVRIYFEHRSQSIAIQFESIQLKLKDSKDELEVAKLKVQEAKSLATDFINSAKKDTVVLGEKIASDAKESCERMQKSMLEEQELARKSVVIKAINEVITMMIDENGLGVDDGELANIITKKVA